MAKVTQQDFEELFRRAEQEGVEDAQPAGASAAPSPRTIDPAIISLLVQALLSWFQSRRQ